MMSLPPTMLRRDLLLLPAWLLLLSLLEQLSVDSVLYSTHSFIAVAKPVTLTMVLAALCTSYIDTGGDAQSLGLSSYEVYSMDTNR